MRVLVTIFLELLSILIYLLYSKHLKQLYLLTMTYLTTPRNLNSTNCVSNACKENHIAERKDINTKEGGPRLSGWAQPRELWLL